MLPEVPVMTARTVERMPGVSFPAAKTALEELLAAGVLTSRQVERKTTSYLAREIFDLLAITERRLASTRWDTREAPPRRPVHTAARRASRSPSAFGACVGPS